MLTPITRATVLSKRWHKVPISQQQTEIMLATNLTGLINMTQASLPIFLRHSGGSHENIINVDSISDREAYDGGSIYCATKAAV
jgi:3-hydroxy acid dehydrogenase/malonic semialdehyde reductase